MRSRATAAGRSHGREGDLARGSTAPASLLSQWAVPLLPGVLTRPPGGGHLAGQLAWRAPVGFPRTRGPSMGLAQGLGLVEPVTEMLPVSSPASVRPFRLLPRFPEACSESVPRRDPGRPHCLLHWSGRPPSHLAVFNLPPQGPKLFGTFPKPRPRPRSSELGAPLRRESAAAPSDPKHRSPSAPTAPPSPQPAASARLRRHVSSAARWVLVPPP